ncbi:MAG: DUF2855 family protein [Actinomycetota bacterium]
MSDVTADRVEATDLGAGQIRLDVDRFGLTTNNVTYAVFGDALGYWAHFPTGDRGCVPVWGFADVVESTHDDVAAGERLFGYLPMASQAVVAPDGVTALSIQDAIEHRRDLHPWYTRLYRCSEDPLYNPTGEPMQAVMWALFMTGWALADQLAGNAASVVVSSASSKTSLALAWSLRRAAPDITIVGLTSPGNASFVNGTGAYDITRTYDDLALGDVVGPAAYVDTAGNPGVTGRVHAEVGDRLNDSITLGATHRGAGGDGAALVGPAPRFFFIPDVAEQGAADNGAAAYHARFASAWSDFAPWIGDQLRIEEASGVDAVVDAYQRAAAGAFAPDAAAVLSW